MAIMQIRYENDPVLRVKNKPVKEITPNLKGLINDMFDTMYESNGVGLAVPQIGVIKRIVAFERKLIYETIHKNKTDILSVNASCKGLKTAGFKINIKREALLFGNSYTGTE